MKVWKRQKFLKQVSIAASIVFILFFIWVIYSANLGILPPLIRKLYSFPGGDKFGHIILLWILSFFANLILYPRNLRIFGISFFMGSLIVSGFITIEEISQYFLSTRTFNLIDLICSYMGIIGGDASVRLFKRAKSNQQ